MITKKISNILLGTLLIILVIATLTVCIIRAQAIQALHNIDENDYNVITYCIGPSDTLWDLGQCFKHDSDELRSWIDAVKDLNDMENSNLIVGKTIQLYSAKS